MIYCNKKLLILLFTASTLTSGAAETYDIVIYGSSPAAISAAVQAKRMDKSCVIVSPETRIGGLTTGGLGQTDIGNKSAFGGIALEFYRAVAAYYRDESNWTRQKRSDYLPDGQCSGSKGVDSMWTFEPSAALKILEGWERRDGLVIHRGKRLDREKGKVKMEGKVKVNGEGGGEWRKIVSFFTEDGTEYRGKVFIDATYEGDLMAAAGASYRVGREANAEYGETLNGVQVGQAKFHQFVKGVDPYVVRGDPKSGLLPNVEAATDLVDGSGDRRVQAYCFRMCLTDVPENRIPFAKPATYDERNYELLLRNYEAGAKGMPWINSKMPNRKTDTNNRTGFSTDFIGRNWRWPEASYAEREQILRAHLEYQQGLMWTLANHPRIPEKVRREVSRWGTCKDEFPDGFGGGWQRQLYVREARRMVGEYVMTEGNCRKTVVAKHPVAMAAYTMDSHHVRRYVADGGVKNEGDVEVGGGKGPYGIDYGAIVPKRGECGNLLVPVCLSATHIAFGSIRMEPVFFALGQAAGTAAAMTGDGCVQEVRYEELAERLVMDGQVIGRESTDEVIASENALTEGRTLIAGNGRTQIALDRINAQYRCGEEAVFTVTVLETNGIKATSGTLKWRLDNYGQHVFQNGEHDLAKGNVFTVKGTLPYPGFLSLVVNDRKDGKTRRYSAAFEPEKIRTAVPKPADFDSFWDNAVAKLEKDVPLDVRREVIPQYSKNGVVVERVSFATWGGKRVHGVLGRPEDMTKGPYPVDVHCPGAGLGFSLHGCAQGCARNRISLFMSVHSFPILDGKDNIQRAYDAQEAEWRKIHGPNHARAYPVAGLTVSREAAHYFDKILGINRAFDWVAKLPGADSRRVVYSGASQGGAMGLILSGLNHSITRAYAGVPAMCDLLGLKADGRQSGWPRVTEFETQKDPVRLERMQQNARYFDAAYFAERIRIPIRLSVGYADESCAPQSVFAAYNAIPSKDKRIYHGIGGVHGSPNAPRKEIDEWLRSACFLQ